VETVGGCIGEMEAHSDYKLPLDSTLGKQHAMTDHSPSEQSAQLVVEVVVPNFGQTVDFLVALGFSVERITGTFGVLRWDDSYLFVEGNPRAVVEQRWINIRVMVPNAQAMFEKVAKIGGRIVSPLTDRDYGLRDFVVAGPGGVEIRFAQVL
jgi:hypothetical protein